jgi:hypothetical protein
MSIACVKDMMRNLKQRKARLPQTSIIAATNWSDPRQLRGLLYSAMAQNAILVHVGPYPEFQEILAFVAGLTGPPGARPSGSCQL